MLISIKRVAGGVAVGALIVAGLLLALDQYIVWRFDPRLDNPSNNVVLYTTDWCGYCAELRTCLTTSGVPFLEKDIEKSTTASNEHWALRGRGVPVTLVGQEVVHGLSKKKLTALLTSSGHPIQCWTTPRDT